MKFEIKVSRQIKIEDKEKYWAKYSLPAAVEEPVEFDGHFAAKSPPVVRRRAFRVDHMAVCNKQTETRFVKEKTVGDVIKCN